MKIVVHSRTWADYHLPEGAKLVRVIEAATRGDMEAITKNPGELVPERVKALAERALKEFLARNQQPETIPAPEAPIIRQRGLLGRLKWALTGR